MVTDCGPGVEDRTSQGSRIRPLRETRRSRWRPRRRGPKATSNRSETRILPATRSPQLSSSPSRLTERTMMTNRNEWHQFADCARRPDLNWHSSDIREIELCRQVCSTCTVRNSCLREAFDSQDPWGLWGGLTPDERDWVSGGRILRILPPHGVNSRYAKHRCRCTPCRVAHTDYERKRRNKNS
jgi:WhiB family redox-sensing transcriptional regulator